MGLFQKVSQIALTPSVAIGNLITKGLEKVTGKEYGRTTSREISSTTAGKILGTAIAATGLAIIPAVAGKAATVSAVKSVVPKTIKGKAIAAITTPVVIGAFISEPVETAKAIASAPGNLAEFGGNIATFAAEPSIQTAKDIFIETPVISTLAAGAGVLAAGAGISSAVSGVLTRQEMQQQTAALQSLAAQPQTIQTQQVLPASSPEVASKTPIIPLEETASIAKTPTRKRKKSRLEPRRQTISQRVNVQVGVNSGNKKYIKNTVLIPA